MSLVEPHARARGVEQARPWMECVFERACLLLLEEEACFSS
jgi:hypothetical protein